MTGNELKELREQRGLSQREFAGRLNISRQSLRKYEELGEKQIPAKVLLIIKGLASEKIG